MFSFSGSSGDSSASKAFADRAAGALVGAVVGDALATGCHWYYDTEEMKRRYGIVSNYVKPKPDWYHAGLKAGDYSQTAEFTVLLAESLAEKQGYDRAAYAKRLDGLLDTLDGTPESGRAEYTDENVRGIWEKRKVKKLDWEDASFPCPNFTSEAAHRSAALAAFYAGDLNKLLRLSHDCSRLTYSDAYVQAQSATFALTVGAAIQGHSLSSFSMSKVLRGAKNSLTEEEKERIVFPTDAILFPVYIFDAAKRVPIEPPIAAAQLYGMACDVNMVLGGAYYYASRYENNFETAVVTAVNAGGSNVARAGLVGALVGGRVGLSKIPKRLIDGLMDSQKIVSLALKIAAEAVKIARL